MERDARPTEPRRISPGGIATVAGLLLFGALFLHLLFAFTRGKRQAPPPETRTPPGRTEGR